MPVNARAAAIALALSLANSASLFAGAEVPLFTDSFTGGASSVWRNEVGGWHVIRGAYDSTISSNFPNSHSSVPYVLADGSIEVDITNVQDGGVWVRSAPAPGTPIGVKGILLVTGPGNGLYWHVVADGSSYGPIIGAVTGLFTSGVSDPHIRVTFVGSTYQVYVNGVLVSTLNDGTFSVGCVGLYDFSPQTFDNVAVYGTPLCDSDLSCDLVVDAADLAILLGAWGQPGIGDLDGNGTTDAADLAILLGAWGPCS